MQVNFVNGVLPLVALVLLATGCDTSIKRTNNANDMEKVEVLVSKFYGLIHDHNIDSAAKSFGSELPYDEGVQLLRSVENMRGGFIDATTDSMGTSVVVSNGIVSSVEGNIYLNCIYEKGQSKENLSVRGKDFESLKIVGYQFALR